MIDDKIKHIIDNPFSTINGTKDHDIRDLNKRKELCLAYKLAIIQKKEVINNV